MELVIVALLTPVALGLYKAMVRPFVVRFI